MANDREEKSLLDNPTREELERWLAETNKVPDETQKEEMSRFYEKVVEDFDDG